MGPIDYLAAQPKPEDFLRSLQGGLQIGQQFAATRLAQQEAEQRAAELQAKKALEAQYQADAQAATQSGDPRAFASLAARYPDRYKPLLETWDRLSTAQQQTELRDASELGAALSNGRPDVALARIDERIATLKEQGQPTKRLETLRDSIKTDPTKATADVMHVIAAIPGGDKVLESLGKVSDEARKVEKEKRDAAAFPIELRTKTAEATTKEAEAAVAGEKARLGVEQLRADVEWKRQDSRIKLLQAAAARESNDLKRQELGLKIEEARAARDQKARDLQADVDAKLAGIADNLATLKDIKDLGGVGWTTGAERFLPYTKGRTVAAKAEQIKGQLTLENTKYLKGAMSDSDIRLLAKSASSLDFGQHPEESMKELARIESIFKRADAAVRKQYNLPPADAAPRPGPKPGNPGKPVVVDY